jgi:predicted amidophosphoribosyltransferase
VRLVDKVGSGFKVVESTYKPNSVNSQCLFCNNQAIDGEEICQECKKEFENMEKEVM